MIYLKNATREEVKHFLKHNISSKYEVANEDRIDFYANDDEDIRWEVWGETLIHIERSN